MPAGYDLAKRPEPILDTVRVDHGPHREVVKIDRDISLTIPSQDGLPPDLHKNPGGILVLSHQFHPAGFARFAKSVLNDDRLSGRCPFCALALAKVARSAFYAGLAFVNEPDPITEVFFSASSFSLIP